MIWNKIFKRKQVYGNYPRCTKCDTALKVCWSHTGFPKTFCDTCKDRFKCYTEKVMIE